MLSISRLSVCFPVNGNGQLIYALRKVDLCMGESETVAVLGESGSGKSVMGMALMSLLPAYARIEGSIVFSGHNVLELGPQMMRKLRGSGIALVPQSSGASLNPAMRLNPQIAEVFSERKGHGSRKARHAALALLEKFGLDAAAAYRYPHQLSGGMKQRGLVAMGLAQKPHLLIADEPTKGTDYQRRGDVIGLFRSARQKNNGMSMLLITHDLFLAESLADRVAVMYAGRLLELTVTNQFFDRPQHPYSRALLNASPERGLRPIPGDPPPAMGRASGGCPFHARCTQADVRCANQFPPAVHSGSGHVHCWQYV